MEETKRAYEKYSVLFSVYHKEKPENFRIAVMSMVNQTVKPDEIIIMCDGPLGEALDNELDKLIKETGDLITVYRLEKNEGLGPALRKGVINSKNELIVRMDTDDVSEADRCEKQFNVMLDNPEIRIVGSNIDEFGGKKPTSRIVPETDSEIRERVKTRTPFNHMTIVYMKSDVIKAGNYRKMHLNEDYDLFMRMLHETDAKAYNVQEPLVKARIDENLFKRRGGLKYAKTEFNLQREFHKKGYIGFFTMVSNIMKRFVVRLMPNKLREFIYVKLLRK